MVTRRGFLQTLLSLPAIAALPAIGQVAETLPLVEPVSDAAPSAGISSGRRVSTWLSIDDKPVRCLSITQRHEVQGLATESSDALMIYKQSIKTHYFECDLIYDPTVYLDLRFDREVELRMVMGDYLFLATARVLRESLNMAPGGPIVQSLDFIVLSASFSGRSIEG